MPNSNVRIQIIMALPCQNMLTMPLATFVLASLMEDRSRDIETRRRLRRSAVAKPEPDALDKLAVALALHEAAGDRKIAVGTKLLRWLVNRAKRKG